MEGNFIFVGPQGTSRKHGRNKGVMRQRKLQKRQEAETRQEAYRELHIKAQAALTA